MKKISIISITALLYVQNSLMALPLGNPADASQLGDGVFVLGPCADFCDPCANWTDLFIGRIGYYGDFVFNRHLEVATGTTQDDNIQTTSLFTNAGLIVINFCDRLDFFTTLGASTFYLESNAISFVGPGSDVAASQGEKFFLESATNFSWSLGGRFTLIECGCFTLGLEAQYFYLSAPVNKIVLAADESLYPTSSLEVRYRESQLGLGISYQILHLAPYLGLRYSYAQANFDNTTVQVSPDYFATLRNLNNEYRWGYSLGVSFIDCERASLTFEGRWPDELAFHVNAQLRF